VARAEPLPGARETLADLSASAHRAYREPAPLPRLGVLPGAP